MCRCALNVDRDRFTDVNAETSRSNIAPWTNNNSSGGSDSLNDFMLNISDDGCSMSRQQRLGDVMSQMGRIKASRAIQLLMIVRLKSG
jgi:hypothetical protein